MKPGIQIGRDAHGVAHIRANNRVDLYWGQGFVHGRDRGLQLLLMRILGKGRACELLEDSDEMLAIDQFFRRMNWCGHTEEPLRQLTAEERLILEAYSDGINTALKKYPWEFKLLGYRPEPWTPEDCLMMTRMVGYLTLAQSQAEIERLFVEMVQAGVPETHLQELFPGILGGLNIPLIQKVTLGERLVPSQLLWQLPVPRMMASNNWVISGKKSASGKPLLANDPHLEVNRLPNVWYELVLETLDWYAVGGSMPGFPGVLIGRNPELAWGATYAFIDAVDSWIEQCKDGCYYREGEGWIPFQERKEIIRRKKQGSREVVFYENAHGVLEGDPTRQGYYLCTRWAPGDGGAQAVSAVLQLFNTPSVEMGMARVRYIETAWSFVFADTRGNIGFQMSGRVPKRPTGVNGFVPLPGWLPENDWQGYHNPEDLPRAYNPENQFFTTANHDLNAYGTIHPINMAMGAYRAERIAQLLHQKNQFTLADMCRMQYDVYSLQAEQFMQYLRPLLPDTPAGRALAQWDCRYHANARGAYVFEQFYKTLYRLVFGQNGFGEAVVQYLDQETGIFADFYANFDRILLSENSVWFGRQSRESIYRKALEEIATLEPRPWGEVQKFMMHHILLGKKLPRFFGFDRGPLTGIGNRATIHQGQIYRSAGRVTTFMPSYRFVVDLAETGLHSNLAGGPSDRRFSRWYCSDLNNWKRGQFKYLSPGTEENLRPFP